MFSIDKKKKFPIIFGLGSPHLRLGFNFFLSGADKIIHFFKKKINDMSLTMTGDLSLIIIDFNH
jgi:hypothetical protein